MSDRYVVLADGSSWRITAGTELAAIVVSRMERMASMSSLPIAPLLAMELGVEPTQAIVVEHDRIYARETLTESREESRSGSHERESCRIMRHPTRAVARAVAAVESGPKDLEVRSYCSASGHLVLQAWLGFRVIAFDAIRNRGVLLHGAAAQIGGQGVILAGPSGVGKSTSVRRLPCPWTSLSDDLALVVRDSDQFYVHGWPNPAGWNGEGLPARINDPVPLRACFFLQQSSEDRATPVGHKEAAGLLAHSTSQALGIHRESTVTGEVRDVQMRAFDAACELAEKIPVFVLSVARHGEFWTEIERVLDEQ